MIVLSQNLSYSNLDVFPSRFPYLSPQALDISCFSFLLIFKMSLGI